VTTPQFSICFITRNEAKTLPIVLDTLINFQRDGGKIYVYDTGSTDDTVAVARARGCLVKEVGSKHVHVLSKEESDAINAPFVHTGEAPIVYPGATYFNFAEARNAAVAEIPDTDYVFCPDADETVTHLDHDKINEFIKEGYTHFKYTWVCVHDPFGGDLVTQIQCKFYDRRAVEWRGRVHELATPKEGVVPKVKLLDEMVLRLDHWQNYETTRTYLIGLAVDCFKDPTNDRNSHYLAREMKWNGRPRGALEEFKRQLTLAPASEADREWLPPFAPRKIESMIYISEILKDQGKLDEELDWVHRAMILEPTRREPVYRLAQIYQARSLPIAAKAYAAAAAVFDWDWTYGTNRALFAAQPREILYWACGWTGDLEGARKYILECLALNRSNPIYIRDTQYYFEYPATTKEGWMSYPEQLFLFRQAKNMESVIELGSWKGASTSALCASGCPSVTAIDHWKGSKFEPDAHAEAITGSVFEQFKKNTAEYKNLRYVNADINDAVRDVQDYSVDMVFIDAGHTYEEVRNDIRKWRSKARILLCGHDYGTGWPGVMRAVDEELGAVDGVEHTVWYKWVNNPRVSICVPTIGRPEKLHRLLETIKTTAEYDNYEVLVAADEPRPNNVGAPKMLAKLVARSKGELVMFLGNDCVPKAGFLREAVWEMARRFPEMDGMVGLNDEYWGKNHVAPHWLASKKLLPYLEGEFFHTGYNHTGCDNELLARVEMIDKYSWAEKSKIWHDHPMMSGKREDMDEYYQEAYASARHDADDRLYAERAKKYGFDGRKWT